MTQPLPDDWISAYLDDELTEDQKLRAEQLLATDEKHARLLDELTALRTDLQSLPRFELEKDLAPKVIKAVLEKPAKSNANVSGTSNVSGADHEETPDRELSTGGAVSPRKVSVNHSGWVAANDRWQAAAVSILSLAALLLISLTYLPAMTEQLDSAQATEADLEVADKASFESHEDNIAISVKNERDRNPDELAKKHSGAGAMNAMPSKDSKIEGKADFSDEGGMPGSSLNQQLDQRMAEDKKDEDEVGVRKLGKDAKSQTKSEANGPGLRGGNQNIITKSMANDAESNNKGMVPNTEKKHDVKRDAGGMGNAGNRQPTVTNPPPDSQARKDKFSKQADGSEGMQRDSKKNRSSNRDPKNDAPADESQKSSSSGNKGDDHEKSSGRRSGNGKDKSLGGSKSKNKGARDQNSDQNSDQNKDQSRDQAKQQLNRMNISDLDAQNVQGSDQNQGAGNSRAEKWSAPPKPKSVAKDSAGNPSAATSPNASNSVKKMIGDIEFRQAAVDPFGAYFKVSGDIETRIALVNVYEDDTRKLQRVLARHNIKLHYLEGKDVALVEKQDHGGRHDLNPQGNVKQNIHSTDDSKENSESAGGGKAGTGSRTGSANTNQSRNRDGGFGASNFGGGGFGGGGGNSIVDEGVEALMIVAPEESIIKALEEIAIGGNVPRFDFGFHEKLKSFSRTRQSREGKKDLNETKMGAKPSQSSLDQLQNEKTDREDRKLDKKKSETKNENNAQKDNSDPDHGIAVRVESDRNKQFGAKKEIKSPKESRKDEAASEENSEHGDPGKGLKSLQEQSGDRMDELSQRAKQLADQMKLGGIGKRESMNGKKLVRYYLLINKLPRTLAGSPDRAGDANAKREALPGAVDKSPPAPPDKDK